MALTSNNLSDRYSALLSTTAWCGFRGLSAAGTVGEAGGLGEKPGPKLLA